MPSCGVPGALPAVVMPHQQQSEQLVGIPGPLNAIYSSAGLTISRPTSTTVSTSAIALAAGLPDTEPANVNRPTIVAASPPASALDRAEQTTVVAKSRKRASSSRAKSATNSPPPTSSRSKRQRRSVTDVVERNDSSRKKGTVSVTFNQAWKQKFDLLCEFQRQNGHMQIPQRSLFKSVPLGKWVKKQRELYKNRKKQRKGVWLSEERIEQLNSIGFEWNETGGKKPIRDDKWQQKFELLQTFHRQNGFCQVPQKYVVGSVKLGVWAMTQRQLYRNRMEGKHARACISDERIAQLNSIGFEWSVRVLPPLEQDGLEVKTNKQVGEVMDTRINKRKAPEASEQQCRMKKLSWCNRPWQEKFDLLRAFQRENGHFRLPTITDDTAIVQLGNWASNQRQFYRKYMQGKEGASITQERIDLLNSIGFDWNLKKSLVDSDEIAHV